jgi:hypothetical protein
MTYIVTDCSDYKWYTIFVILKYFKISKCFYNCHCYNYILECCNHAN